MDTTIIEKLKKELESFTPTHHEETVGRVTASGDGIAEISGLEKAMMAEMVVFDDTEHSTLEEATHKKDILYGLILNLEEDLVRAVILGDSSRVSEGMLVKSLGKVLSIGVSEEILGRVVSPLVEPLDGKGSISADQWKPIERVAYGVMDRKSVDTPIHTGWKAVDAMIPIGRGQRELIIGDRFTGKTTIAVDTIINQKEEPKDTRPICIYVAIGQKESKTAQLVQLLKEHGAMDYTIIVDAPASSPAALQFLAPFAGAAIGEYFMEKGKDALVIYDDLSKHAVAYRQMSLLLRRPPGREAYPGDVFYLHSRLLERAAKLSDTLGGGSLTALPIIETQENDVSAYIPTNVISITDGQIFLETDLFNKGFRPAINVGISVSRVGSAAQTKAMKKVAGRMKLDLAQFRELEAFMQFASDLDPDTKKRIDEGQRLTEALKQDKHMPMPFEQQAVVMYAATHHFYDGVPVAKVSELEKAFLAYIEREMVDVLDTIKKSRNLEDPMIEKIESAMNAFRDSHAEFWL